MLLGIAAALSSLPLNLSADASAESAPAVVSSAVNATAATELVAASAAANLSSSSPSSRSPPAHSRPRHAQHEISRVAPYAMLPCHTSSDCPEFCFCRVRCRHAHAPPALGLRSRHPTLAGQGNKERETFNSMDPADYSLLGGCVCEGNTGWGDVVQMGPLDSHGSDRRAEAEWEWDRMFFKTHREEDELVREEGSTASNMAQSRDATDEPAPENEGGSTPPGESGPVALTLLAAALSAAAPLHASSAARAAREAALANASLAAATCSARGSCGASGAAAAPPDDWNASASPAAWRQLLHNGSSLGNGSAAEMELRNGSSLLLANSSNATAWARRRNVSLELLQLRARRSMPLRPLPPIGALHAALPSQPLSPKFTKCCFNKNGMLPPPLDDFFALIASWIGSVALVVIGFGYCYNCCVNNVYRWEVTSRPRFLGGPLQASQRKVGLQCWMAREIRVMGKWTQCEDGYDEPPGCLAEPPEEGPDDRCIFRHCRTYQRDSKEFPGGGDVAHDGKPDCSLREETLCREKEVCRTILLDAGIADERIDRSLRAAKYEEEEGAPTDRRWTRSDVYDHWHDPPEELHYGIFTIKKQQPPMFYHTSHYVKDTEGKGPPTLQGDSM